MNPEQIYERCCEDTEDLLRGLETGDLPLIARQIHLLRESLARRPAANGMSVSGSALLRLEQLDALDGITQRMEQNLQIMEKSVRAEFEQMLTVRDLVRHLTRRRGAPRLPPLSVS